MPERKVHGSRFNRLMKPATAGYTSLSCQRRRNLKDAFAKATSALYVGLFLRGDLSAFYLMKFRRFPGFANVWFCTEGRLTVIVL